MSSFALVSLVLSVSIPVLAAILLSRFVLPRVAARFARFQGQTSSAAVIEAIRGPLLILSALVAVYLASQILQGEDLSALRWVHWATLDLWIRVAATLLVFLVAYRAVLFGIRIASTRSAPGSTVLVQKVLSAFFLGIAIVTALKQFSIDIGPVLASLGVAALAVALALQDTLSNYFAGITLALDRPIRPGDYVRLEGGLDGFVETIGWRTTHIKPFSEAVVVVPNSKLANSILTNTYYPDAGVRVYVDGGVSYESDLDEVERTVLEVARAVRDTVEGADPEFEPICLFSEFGDSNIQFRAILRATRYAFSARIKHATIKGLHAAFRERGIEMNYPVRKIISVAPGSESSAKQSDEGLPNHGVHERIR